VLRATGQDVAPVQECYGADMSPRQKYFKIHGVSDEQVAAVLEYLRDAFPNEEIITGRQNDSVTQRFSIVRNSEVLHVLLVRRLFFDNAGPDLPWALKATSAARKMREAGTASVILGPAP